MDRLRNDGHPFIGTASAHLGLSHDRLRELVRRRALRRVLRGVYVDDRVPDTRAVRARALELVKPERAVFYGNTATYLMGVETHRPGDRFDLMPRCIVPHGTVRCCSPMVVCKEGYLSPSDVVTIEGIAVTSPVRSTVDLLRTMWRPYALSAADAMAHAGLVSADEVTRYLSALRGFPGIVQARELAGLIEPATESHGESWQRLRLVDAGFPRPTPQILVSDRAGNAVARLDMGYAEVLVAAEYDGAVDHTGQADREHDTARRERLRDTYGWRILASRKADILGDDPAFEHQIGEWIGLQPVMPRRW